MKDKAESLTRTYEITDTKGNIWKVSETTSSIAKGNSWRNKHTSRGKIIHAYLSAIENAEGDFLTEFSNVTKEYDTTTETNSGGVKGSTLNKTHERKFSNRDKLIHYEKLSKCFVEMQRNTLRGIIAVCATVVICFTIACCLLNPRMNQNYQTKTSVSYNNSEEVSQTVETIVSCN